MSVFDELIQKIEARARKERRSNRPLYEKLVEMSDILTNDWKVGTPLPDSIKIELLSEQIELTPAERNLLSGELDQAAEVTTPEETESPSSSSPPPLSTETINSIIQIETIDVDKSLEQIAEQASRGDFTGALTKLAMLSDSQPEEQRYQDLLALIRTQQAEARDAKAAAARQAVAQDPTLAEKLFNEAIQIDPQSKQIYQTEIGDLLKHQQYREQERDVRNIERRVGRRFNLEQGKELLEEIDEKIGTEAFEPFHSSLESLRQRLDDAILSLELKREVVSTMEGLGEFDKAITSLQELISGGETVFEETRTSADGSEQLTQEIPIGDKLRELRVLRGQGRVKAATKWRARAEKSMARGYPDHAINLLKQALSPDLNDPSAEKLNMGIGDVTPDLVSGVDDLRVALKDRLEQIYEDKQAYLEAGELFDRAQKTASADAAITLLLEAIGKFPSYPNLQTTLRRRQQGIIGSIIVTIQNRIESGKRALKIESDIPAAQLEVHAGREAATHLRGLTLKDLQYEVELLEGAIADLENELNQESTIEKKETQDLIKTQQQELRSLESLVAQRNRLDELLAELNQLGETILTEGEEIRGVKEANDAFELSLNDKKAKFDAAVTTTPPDMAVAQAIYESLSDKEKADPRGGEIFVRFKSLQGNQSAVMAMESAYRQGDYDIVWRTDLTHFKTRGGPNYARALELKSLAHMQLLRKQYDIAVRGGVYDKDRLDGSGVVSIPSARTVLNEMKQIVSDLADNQDLLDELRTSEEALNEIIKENAQAIRQLDRVRTAIEQTEYVRAHHLIEEAKFPLHNSQAQGLKVDLIKAWREAVLPQVLVSEEHSFAEIAAVYERLGELRAAHLIYSEEESAVRPLEIHYWTLVAQQAEGGTYPDLTAAHRAWEEVLKLKPADAKAEKEKERLASILSIKTLQNGVKDLNDEIYALLQTSPPNIEAAENKVRNFPTLLPEAGMEIKNFWTRLIRIYKLAHEQSIVIALEELEQLRIHSARFIHEESLERQNWFEQTEYPTWRHILLAALIDNARESERPGSAAGDMQVLIIWGQVLRYEPENEQAQQAIQLRQTALQQSTRNLLNQGRQLKMGAQTADEAAAQAEQLIRETDGVLQILDALSQDNEVQQLKTMGDNLRSRKQTIHDLNEQIEKGTAALRHALTSKFDLTLTQARQHLHNARDFNPDESDPKILSDFDAVFRETHIATRGIFDTLKALRKNFAAEDFSQVSTDLQTIEEYWRKACVANGVGEETALPTQTATVTDSFGQPAPERGDPYRTGRLEGVAEIQKQAVLRHKNRAEWDKLSKETVSLVANSFDLAERAQEFLEAGPLKMWPKFPEIRKNNAADALSLLRIASRDLSTQRETVLNRSILSRQAGQLLHDRFRECLRGYNLSPFVYEDPDLDAQIKELTTVDGLQETPVELHQHIDRLLQMISKKFDLFYEEFQQRVNSDIAQIEQAELNIYKHEHLFVPNSRRGVAQVVKNRVRDNMDLIRKLDPSYNFNRPYMESVIYPEKQS